MSNPNASPFAARRGRRVASEGDLSCVARIDPQDGAGGVFRDACVMAQLSAPADPTTLSATTFRVDDPHGPVPAKLRLSPDRLVVIWIAERLLLAGAEHIVQACGLRDVHGHAVAPHRSHFVPCELVSTDWPP